MDISLVYECDCGGEANSYTFIDDDDRKLDFAMACSQLMMRCNRCQKKYYTGDIEVYSEDEI